MGCLVRHSNRWGIIGFLAMAVRDIIKKPKTPTKDFETKGLRPNKFMKWAKTKSPVPVHTAASLRKADCSWAKFFWP